MIRISERIGEIEVVKEFDKFNEALFFYCASCPEEELERIKRLFELGLANGIE